MSRSWGEFKEEYGLSSTKTLGSKKKTMPWKDSKEQYGSSSNKTFGSNGQPNSWDKFKIKHGISNYGKSWDKYQTQNILTGKDQTYNSWIEDFNTFSNQMTNDYSERENTYQNPDEFGLYADESISAAEELLSKTKAAKSFYTNNRDAAEKAYGEGSVDEVLMSLEEGEKYIEDIISGINDESDYWKKWESVEDWGNSAKKHASDSMKIFSQSGSNALAGMGSLYDQIKNADLTTAEGQAFYKSLMDTIEPDVNAFILDNAELNAKKMIQDYSKAGGEYTAGMGSLYDQIEKTDFDTAEGQAFYSSLRATVEPALADKTSVFTYVKPYATQEEITANYIEGIEEYYADEREELDTLIQNAINDPDFEKIADQGNNVNLRNIAVLSNSHKESFEEGYVAADKLHLQIADYYREMGNPEAAEAVRNYNTTMKELDEQEKQKINAAPQEVSAVHKSIEVQEEQEVFYSHIDSAPELDPLEIRKSEDYIRNVKAGKTAHVEPTSKYFITVSSLKAVAAGYEIHSLSGLTDEQINDALYFVGQEDYESAQFIIDGRKIEDILSINAVISNQTADMEEDYVSEREELDTYIDEALDDPDFQKIVDEYREKYGNLTSINQANYGAYEGWSPNDMHCKVADYYRGKGDHKKANAVFHYNETIPQIDDHWQKKIKETSYLIEEEMIKRELEDINDPEFEETAGQFKVFDMYSLDSYNELEAEGEFEVGSLTMMGLAQDPYVSYDEIQDMSLMTKEQRQYYAYYMMTDKAKANQYLSVIRREMNARRAERMREDIAETVEKPGGRLLLAIQSIPLKLVSGISWIGAGIDSLGEYKPADPNAWYMIPAQMAAETRAGSTSNMGGVEQFFANAALSIADFAVAYFATGGAGAMASAIGKATLTTLMATEAAGLATYDVLQRGGSTGEAFWTGTLVGGVEAATELISIGALDDAFKAIKKGADGTRILQNIVRQGVAEGGEEVISEIGGNIADNLINGRNSNYYRYIDELMLGGKSREEARNLAQLKFFGTDLVLAFTGGTLSGFAMGSGVSAYGHYSTQSKIDNMVATTLGWDESVYKSLPKDSKTYLREQFKTFLNKVSGDVISEKLKLTDGISMSPEKVAKLTEINGELAKSLKTEISNAEERLSELNAVNKPTQEQKTQIEQLTEQIKSDQIYLEVVNESIDEMKSKAIRQQGQAQDTEHKHSGIVPYSYEQIETLHKYGGLAEGRDISIGDFYDLALAERAGGSNKPLYFGVISPWLAEQINEATGFNTKGANFRITDDDILHTDKYHGTNSVRAKNGEIPITRNEIILIPQIISNPDEIIKGNETGGAEKNIILKKRINGYIAYVQVFAERHGNKPPMLTGKTLYIQNAKKTKDSGVLDAKSPSLTSETASGSPSTNSIRSSNNKINSTNRKAVGQSNQAKDPAETGSRSAQKLETATFKVGGAKANVKGIASVQGGKVTVELENGDLAIADDLKFKNKKQAQLYDKARHFDTNSAKTFVAVYEANIPVNDYYLGFTAIHGAARTGTAFEQALQINEYTAALPKHIQKAAYNAGAKAGAITEDAPMKNATSVRAKAEQQSYDKWLKKHTAEVIAKKKEIGERFKEAEANGDVAEMNKQRKEYQALDQWSEETIRDKKAQIGKAVGGVVKLGGEKVDVQADKTGLSANATDISANATDIGKTAGKVQALAKFATVNGVNDLALSMEEILRFSGNRTDLAQSLILATKEVVEGKTVPELAEMFGLTDNPRPGSLSAYQTRVWYLWQESLFDSRLDYSKPLEQVARDAFEMRNSVRTKARESMSDTAWAEYLKKAEKNKTFEELVEYYMKKGYFGESLWNKIIESSKKSRDEVNKIFKLN